MTSLKFSTYHIIRAHILDFVEPYIIKLIDPLHAKALWNGFELRDAIRDNNLECAKIYAAMFTGNIDKEIKYAITFEYIDIVKALLPRAIDHCSMMKSFIDCANVELMRLIWSTKPYDYWTKFVSRDRWSDDFSFVDRDIVHGISPVNLLLRKWFVKLIF